MALNALLDSFCHNQKKCGAERVNGCVLDKFTSNKHTFELLYIRVQLVPGWVTMSGVQLPVQENQWVGAMSTSQRAVILCGWGVKESMVCVWVAGKTV